MTMGANPLLSYYLNISAARIIPISNGVCAKTTLVERPLENEEWAAPLDADTHKYNKPGTLRCFDEHWASLEQGRHLVNVYKTLLQNGNHVLVVGYPAGCPWSFGDWQVVPNFVEGPAYGHPCTSRKAPVWDGSGELSQFDQARALVNNANDKIQAAVDRAASELPSTIPSDRIRFALPDQAEWARHQAWDGSPWFFKNDTWVHPNADGHKQLAATVVGAMCSFFHHWCGTPPHWSGAGSGRRRRHS
jgi:hypothetical protein